MEGEKTQEREPRNSGEGGRAVEREAEGKQSQE